MACGTGKTITWYNTKVKECVKYKEKQHDIEVRGRGD